MAQEPSRRRGATLSVVPEPRADRGVAPGLELERAGDEVRDLGRLAFGELAGLVGGIGQIHRGVATRAFRATGPAARPARAAHDAIARSVYGSIKGAATAAGRAADRALAHHPADTRAVSADPRGALALAALNGLIGDALEAQGSALQQPMSVRVDGEVVTPSPDAVADAFPAATPRVVVFVHGLMGTEHTWRWHAGPHGDTYATRLRREHGFTPVEVRYNTGRHISQNGRSLHELLGALVAAWPVEIERLALVGHSMGGLVSRSACHHGAEAGARWVRSVTHVVSLGTPHMGAPLAQGVHLASAALDRLPETRPVSRFLRRRSSGIRDLRRGSLVDADWRDADPDALRATACEEIPLLEGAVHCFVSATITRSDRHPLGRLVGDWLVLSDSASGRSRQRRIPFEAEYGHHVGGAGHIALLNHPRVYEKLREWLAS